MHIVTATIKPQSRLRQENVIPKRSRVFSSGFTGPGGVEFFFRDVRGSNEADLVIDDEKTFNLDNEVDRHNWDTLKVFCALNKDFAKDIQLIDQEEENNKSIQFADKVFKVESFLRENKSDYNLLSKLYRRIVGLAAGLTENTIFRTLLEKAKENPSLFLKTNKIIIENEGFEMLALLDVSIERGFMHRDLDKTIKKSDGTIYAPDIDKAAFQLKSDDALRVYLQRAIDGFAELSSAKDEPMIEDSDYVLLAEKVGMKHNKPANTADDFTLNIQANLAAFDSEFGDSFKSFMEAKLIEKIGAGISTRYFFPEMDDKLMTKKEMMEHLRKNTSQYALLKKQAAVK